MRGVHLDVDEFSPWFFITGEALHESGITVSATMSASHIGIDTVVETGDGCFSQNGLEKISLTFTSNIITEREENRKFSPSSSPPARGGGKRWGIFGLQGVKKSRILRGY